MVFRHYYDCLGLCGASGERVMDQLSGLDTDTEIDGEGESDSTSNEIVDSELRNSRTSRLDTRPCCSGDVKLLVSVE